MYAKMRKDPTTPSNFFTEEGAAQLWMNGASDHLYELIKPKRGVGNPTWHKARFVQSEALDIGHGFRRPTSPQECQALLDNADQLLWLTQTETLEEALTWDRDHGIKPDTGSWSCPYDLIRMDLVKE